MRKIDPIQIPVSNDDAVTLQSQALRTTPMQNAVSLCGRAAGPVQLDTVFGAANENAPTAEGLLFYQLPEAIRTAVDEWAVHLAARPWRFRREAMTRFAEIFADQFRQHMDTMSEDEYEGLREVGYTCLLERLDDGGRINDLHQARIFLDSVHDHHKDAANYFLARQAPKALESIGVTAPAPHHV
jgi:hypothetical protein